MSGSIQSSNYVPGKSGLRIDLKTGEFELSSGRITAGSLPTDPQLITITAGDWSDYDLPVRALERYAFIGAEVAKIPAEYRDSAEFSTRDLSIHPDDSPDIRTTLTYERHETAEEVAARVKKGKASGTSIKLEGGVMTITHDGAPRLQIGNMPQAFIVAGDQVFISEAVIEGASILKPALSAHWSVKMQVNANGQYVAAGIGLGDQQVLVSADRFTFNGRATEQVLDDMAALIGRTELGKCLRDRIDSIASPASIAEVSKTLDEFKEKQAAENRAVAARLDTQAAALAELREALRLGFRRPR